MGTSIGKVGFFGETYQKLWCLTHIETLRYIFPIMTTIVSVAELLFVSLITMEDHRMIFIDLKVKCFDQLILTFESVIRDY